MVARSPTSLALSQPASPSLEVDLGQASAGAARVRPSYAFASARASGITPSCWSREAESKWHGFGSVNASPSTPVLRKRFV